MGTLLTTKNGRLRTGRVTVIVFIGIILCATMLFKVAKPIDQAVVAVKHVFEPQVKQQDVTEPMNSNASVKIEKSEKIAETEKTEPAPPEPETEQSVVPPGQKIAEKPEPLPNDTVLEKEQIDEVVVESESIETKQIENDDQQQEKKIKTALMSDKPASTPSPETSRVNLDISKEISRLLVGNETENVSEPKEKRLAVIPKPSSTTADVKKSMVTVDKKQYKQLFSDWRKAGSTAQDNDKVREKVSLRVENLREVYDLFQMKPVVKTKGMFIDLETGMRVPGEALDQYSNTVFLVDDPWEKWGSELKSAGVKRSDTIDVRYYMYGFIKDAIYARAGKAFEWSRNQGLTEQKISPADADILGKAFIINQDGGGRFGVFVPHQLTLKDGSTASISPDCFQGERDVDTLVTAGLL